MHLALTDTWFLWRDVLQKDVPKHSQKLPQPAVVEIKPGQMGGSILHWLRILCEKKKSKKRSIITRRLTVKEVTACSFHILARFNLILITWLKIFETCFSFCIRRNRNLWKINCYKVFKAVMSLHSFAIYCLKEESREIPNTFLMKKFNAWNRFHWIFLNPNTFMWMFIKLKAI